MKEIGGKFEQKPSFKNQYLATLVVNIPLTVYNISFGWSSPSIILLTSEELTPLPSGALNMDEVSWMTSILYFGAFIGTFFLGFGISHRDFGRKWPMIIISTLGIISWLLILYAQNVYYLYVSRFLSGFFGSGLSVLAPVFMQEIASDSVRGIVLSSMGISATIGILIGFTLGAFCSFYTTPIFAIVLTILFAFVFYVFFPETPSFLINRNKSKEAKKSIQFYQNLDSEELKSETASTGIKNNHSSFKWSDLITNPGRKAIIIGVGLVVLHSFSGIFIILNYFGTIFGMTGSAMSPNESTVILGFIQVVGSLIANHLIDRAGRKILYILSSLGTAFGLSILGVFMMLKSWNYPVDDFNWIPIATLSFSVLITYFAVQSLPLVVCMEILPTNLKEFGISLCITLMYVLTFVLTKLLPVMLIEFQFHGCMFGFASFCLFGALLIVLYLPETKGKSHEQIMLSLQ